MKFVLDELSFKQLYPIKVQLSMIAKLSQATANDSESHGKSALKKILVINNVYALDV